MDDTQTFTPPPPSYNDVINEGGDDGTCLMNHTELYDEKRNGDVVKTDGPWPQNCDPERDQTVLLLRENGQICDGDPEGHPETVDSGAEQDEGPEREVWGKKLDFLLSVIGFAVDLSNVWRFPYICFRNGGGAFLIPYLIMLLFLGLPLFYMELALGQFHRCGAIKIWQHLCPMFKGIGFAVMLVATYVGMYYNTIIAWALYYMFMSFRSEVPWASCTNEWNTPDCFSITRGYNLSDLTNRSVPAAAEYFKYHVLESHKSTGIGDIGAVKWTLCLCLFGVMVTVYFSLWRGIKSSGKAVWITATVPYIVLLILLVRGATLPGAGEGIKYFLQPQWSRLLDSGVWIDAAAQIFFSLGPGFGTLMALSSYNKFNNNCYFDAIVTAVINCLTSLLAGFVVFAVLGYMAHMQSVSLDDLAVQGPGLVFIVYPEAIATLKGSVFWAILFFVMLFTLGLDSTFGGLESVITAFCDISPKLAKRREVFVFVVVAYCFLGSIPSTTYGGQYVITLLDTHAAPVALIFICFVEAIAVNWFYGVQRFSNDIEKMLGFQPGYYWKICWVAVCPLVLFVLFILSIVAYQGLSLEGYEYPLWSEVVGWLITVSSLMCIPIYIIYMFIITPGSVTQKLNKMIRPGYGKAKINGTTVQFVNQSEGIILNSTPMINQSEGIILNSTPMINQSDGTIVNNTRLIK